MTEVIHAKNLSMKEKQFVEIRNPILPDHIQARRTKTVDEYVGVRLFTIDHFLTENECKNIISQIDNEQTKPVQEWYNSQLRKHKRALITNEEMSSRLFDRLVEQMSAGDIKNIVPPGREGDSGIWLPCKLNPVFRFAKYSTGDYFRPHMDVSWCEPDGSVSIFSLLIYLNGQDILDWRRGRKWRHDSQFHGGATAFYPGTTKKNPLYVHPVAGRAVVFNHDVLHEGLPVDAGEKLLLRTDVMFRLVNETIPKPLTDEQTEISEMFDQALTARVHHHEALEKGEYSIGSTQCADAIDNFTSLFIEATQLQHSHQSSTKDLLPSFPPHIYEVQLEIATFLDLYSLCDLRLVSRSTHQIATDGYVWRPHYLRRFWNCQHKRHGPDLTVYWFGDFIQSKQQTLSLRKAKKREPCALSGHMDVELADSDRGEFWIFNGEPIQVTKWDHIYGCHGYAFSKFSGKQFCDCTPSTIKHGDYRGETIQEVVRYKYTFSEIDNEGFPLLVSEDGERRNDISLPFGYLEAAKKALKEKKTVACEVLYLEVPGETDSTVSKIELPDLRPVTPPSIPFSRPIYSGNTAEEEEVDGFGLFD